MLRAFAKKMLRPFYRRIESRVDKIAHERISAELRPFYGRIESRVDKIAKKGVSAELERAHTNFDKTAQRVSDETNEKLIHLQRQIDRLRVDLYFAHLSSGRVFAPAKAVELKVPNSAIEMILCGPAEDRSIIRTITIQDGYYEPHIISALSRLIPQTASCIDIGANLGAISLQLSKIAPNGHIYSFEPTFTSFNYLTQNIAANHIDNITAYNLRISDQSNDLVRKYVSDLSAFSFVMGANDFVMGANDMPAPPDIARDIASAKEETIHCISIDDWVSQNNIRPIDFIKLDTKGMEHAALRGARKLLSRDKPDLAIGFNPRTNEDFGHRSPRELYDELTSYWDQVYLIPRDMSEPLVPIRDFDQLMSFVKAGPGGGDLFCTTDKRQGTGSCSC